MLKCNSPLDIKTNESGKVAIGRVTLLLGNIPFFTTTELHHVFSVD